MKWIASLVATCLISVPLRPQDLSPTTNARANSQVSSELILGERLAREYENQRSSSIDSGSALLSRNETTVSPKSITAFHLNSAELTVCRLFDLRELITGASRSYSPVGTTLSNHPGSRRPRRARPSRSFHALASEGYPYKN